MFGCPCAFRVSQDHSPYRVTLPRDLPEMADPRLGAPEIETGASYLLYRQL